MLQGFNAWLQSGLFAFGFGNNPTGADTETTKGNTDVVAGGIDILILIAFALVAGAGILFLVL